MIARAGAAFLLLAVLSGCARETPRAPIEAEGPAEPAAGAFRDSPAARWRRGSATLDSLAAADRIEAALELARRRVREADTAGAPGWRVAEARVVERGFARRVTMAAEDRHALAAADRALLAARRMREADSLASALDLLRRAWTTRVRIHGPRDVLTAEAALALGEAEQEVAHILEADSLGNAALDVFASELGGDHPWVADAEVLLGLILKNYTGRRAFAAAMVHYDKALRIRIAAEGPFSLAVAASRHDRANLLRLAERWEEAHAEFLKALEIRRAAHGPVHGEVASTLGGMAFLRASQGRWSEAEALVRQALAATPPGSSAAAWSARLGLRGQVLRRLGRPGEAVTVLSQAVAVRESVWARTPRDPASSFAAGLNLHRDLALALAEVGRGGEAFEELERGTSRTLAARLTGIQGDPWQSLLARTRAALAADEAVVVWPRSSMAQFGDNPLYACVVRSRGPAQWIRLPRVSPTVRGVGAIREVLWTELRVAASWPRRVTDSAPARSMARSMCREWFSPLEVALAGVRHIIVCSPDFVAGGPLGALIDERGRWLDERFTISYAPSALWFTWERARLKGGTPSRSRPSLLVGDPAYAPADSARWSRLAGATEEIRDLATRLHSPTLLTGAEARAGRLRELAATDALARFGIIHVATHAENRSRRVLQSSLVLAPDAAGADNSRVEAQEIASSWRIDADLVCLAACRSAAGLLSATEGALGLQQAFLAAGARSLLVTLWPIDDGATALLMREFYARFTDASRPQAAPEALRGAQAALRAWRAPDGTQPFAHPAYWAGFVVVCD